jgi:hypothetical protein
MAPKYWKIGPLSTARDRKREKGRDGDFTEHQLRKIVELVITPDKDGKKMPLGKIAEEVNKEQKFGRNKTVNALRALFEAYGGLDAFLTEHAPNLQGKAKEIVLERYKINSPSVRVEEA